MTDGKNIELNVLSNFERLQNIIFKNDFYKMLVLDTNYYHIPKILFNTNFTVSSQKRN